MAEIQHEVEPEQIAEPASTEFYPRVYLEVSKEQLDVLEVGKEIQLTLQGKVMGVNSQEEHDTEGRHEIQLNLKKVIIDTEEMNEFTELAEED